VDLARHNNQGPIQIGEISKRQDISVKYLEQLIRPLKQANLVESVRGPKGGHMLAKKPRLFDYSKARAIWLNVSAILKRAIWLMIVRYGWHGKMPPRFFTKSWTAPPSLI
jgi:DNA-binding MarR family transcriptional regulator